jgi:hypothetical protein
MALVLVEDVVDELGVRVAHHVVALTAFREVPVPASRRERGWIVDAVRGSPSPWLGSCHAGP